MPGICQRFMPNAPGAGLAQTCGWISSVKKSDDGSPVGTWCTRMCDAWPMFPRFSQAWAVMAGIRNRDRSVSWQVLTAFIQPWGRDGCGSELGWVNTARSMEAWRCEQCIIITPKVTHGLSPHASLAREYLLLARQREALWGNKLVR